jgi:hypothetical protein
VTIIRIELIEINWFVKEIIDSDIIYIVAMKVKFKVVSFVY